ncbi:hypothetical protein TI39_contig1085g00005 [Zymoseptoria brevis]|uniref:Uncharacterized protein n=1 Tax=Zymoseptoria brevis TaxID=1047168 RepID=A0A0F4GE94_9PEZI|nr:hypothetical protein TI39_contig1085g00005 [Zymoseptoria brevis]
MARLYRCPTRPPPPSPPPPRPLDQLVSCAANPNEGTTALELFRSQWRAQKTSPVTSSIALPRQTTVELNRHFETIYVQPTKDRSLRGHINFLVSRKCPWSEELRGGLDIYALFGARGITRSFLLAFRRLTGLRTDQNEPLRLARAMELIEQAAEQRRSGRSTVPRNSHDAD